MMFKMMLRKRRWSKGGQLRRNCKSKMSCTLVYGCKLQHITEQSGKHKMVLLFNYCVYQVLEMNCQQKGMHLDITADFGQISMKQFQVGTECPKP